MSEQALHLFRGPESRLGHGEEVVSATSAADAWEVWRSFTGETPEDYPGCTWSQIADDQPFTLVCAVDTADERDLPLSEDGRVTYPAGVWAARGHTYVGGKNF